MDYEQKYNKLVNAIKVLQEANPSDEGIQNWVNDNVPELRESEDEEVRKDILAFVKREGQHIDKYKWHKWIDWLEKQGQNPTWSEEDENGLGDALWCCKQAASIAKDENDMGNVWYAEQWLKAIKNRIKGE